MGGLFHLVLRRLDRCGVRAVVIVRAFILIGQDFLVDLEILDQRVDLLDADRAGHDQAEVSPLRCSTGCHLPRLSSPTAATTPRPSSRWCTSTAESPTFRPSATARFSVRSIPGSMATQSDRAVLLQTQTLQTHCHPLRQTRQKLPRRCSHRIDQALAQSL